MISAPLMAVELEWSGVALDKFGMGRLIQMSRIGIG